MAVMYFNVKQGIQTGNVVIDAASGNISNIGNIILVGGTSANLGNLTISNYFKGDGSLLTSITGANVTGYVPNATAANTAVSATSATTAGTVTTAAQPNITSLGTLSGITLSSNGNIAMNGSASQISGGNLVNANYISGNGSLLTSITGTNVTGYVPNATDANTAITAGTVTTASQPNITSVGTLSGVTLSSNGNIAMNGPASQISGGNLVNANYISGNGSLLTSITGTNVTGYVPNATAANTAVSATTAGTVTTAAQSNITSVGTLTDLTVSGNVFAPAIVQNASTYDTRISLNSGAGIVEISTNGNATKFGPGGGIELSGASQVTGGTFGGSGITLGTSQTDLFQNRGGNVTVQVGTSGTINSTWTFENGGNLSAPGKITSAGLVSNSIVDFTTASNVSLGSISNLHITGGSSGYVLQTDGSGNLTFVSAGSTGIAGANTEVQFNDGGSFGASNTFTFNKGTNTLSATNFAGNGALLTNITGANVTGYVPLATAANTAGTVTTASQPNITSVGTLLGLSITGNIDITGNINATGNLNYDNVTDLVVGDPLIFLGANNTGNLYDLGFVASYTISNTFYHTGLARDATDGTYKLYDQVITEPTTVIDFANGTYAPFKTGAFESTGNILALNANLGNLATASYFSGNGYYLTGIQASGGSANTAGTVTTAAQPNITSVGTLTSITLSSNGNISMNGIASQISGANLISANYFSGNGYYLTSVQAAGGNADTAGTVTTNAQPNITSTGTLTGVTIGSNGNISMNGVASQISGANLVSANYVSGTLTTAAQPNITSVGTLTGVTIGSNGNISMNGIASQISGGNLVSANYVSGTLTTAAQPNITSVGNLSILNVVGNVSAGNLKSDNLLYANGSPYVFTTSAAGSNTQVQFNDGNSFAGSAAFTFNKGSNILTATNFAGNGALLTNITGANVTGYVPLATAANTAGTVTTAAQPNITSVGTLSSLTVSGNLITGNANVTGTLTAGSIATSGAGTGNISGADYVIANYFSGNGSLLTSITGSNVTGNVTSALQSHYANIANSVAGANVSGQVGNALIAGTVYTAAQPNITSVGTLSSLNVTGTANVGTVSLTNGLTSNRSNVSVTTNTVIDQFTPSTYRTAKYIISASGTYGYQSVETLLVHDGSSAYITIYGSVCSNVSADIVELSSNVNGVSGNVTLYATTASPSTKVNVVVTYINT